MSEAKKIILVIADSKGKNRIFVTNDFEYILLDKAIALVKKGLLEGVHLVESKNGKYIRSNPNNTKKDNLNNLSVPGGSILEKLKELPTKDNVVDTFAKAYGKYLEFLYNRNDLLYLDGIARISRKSVKKQIRPLKKKIKDAAQKHGVDAHLLAAILIDEFARTGPDDLLDILGKLNITDTSVGLAQIKLSTARDMIKKNYYEDDPNISQFDLYNLLADDSTAVQFAAAYLRFIKKYRQSKGADISPAGLASSYSGGLLAPIGFRGEQIATKLRKFAKDDLLK